MGDVPHGRREDIESGHTATQGDEAQAEQNHDPRRVLLMASNGAEKATRYRGGQYEEGHDRRNAQALPFRGKPTRTASIAPARARTASVTVWSAILP